jgi:transcriptional regulator with XRE-family HTH domain
MPALATQPRQLDIIADTALREDPRLKVKNHSGSSTVIALDPETTNHSGSSTVLETVDRRRKAAGLSHDELCRAAGIEVNNWFRLLRGAHQPSPATLRKLQAALDAPRQSKPPQIIAGFHRVLIGLLADAMGADRAAVLAVDMSKQRPQNPAWLRAARIRMMATYIAAVELEVGNAELGRAIGQTRQAIQKSRNQVEDLRDDPAIEAALTLVTAQVRA